MRTGITVHLSPTDRKRLRAIVDDRNSAQKQVWRAKIVLATAEPEAWAAARKLLAARPVLVLSPLRDATPAAAFLKAWADFGLDTAKTRGTFKAAIPRPNLLKFPG